MTDVAVATTSFVADPDLPALLGALRELGCDAVATPWDDPHFAWGRAGLTVLRSTWDYAARPDEFVAWTRGVPRLCNPHEVVAWDLDKHYLGELASRGVPVVPTTYADRGADAVLPDGELVVKPSVGAGSRGAARFPAGEGDAARAHVDDLAARGLVALVQPYLAAAELGEVDVVVLDGVVSHAVRKRAPMGLAADALPQGPLSVETVTPSAEVLGVVAATLDALPFDRAPCYARVDVVEDAAGPLVLEVELIEPFLFLGHDPSAAARLARAILSRL